MSVDLSRILDKPDVQAAVQLVAERVANHAVAEQGEPALSSAKYHEGVEESVADAVESAVRASEVDAFPEWADGYDLDAGADLQRDRAVGL